jgi:hypothetical protein
MSRNKFKIEVTTASESDAADGGKYTEVRVSITENGYQWHTQRFPAEKWPQIVDAINKAISRGV